MFRSCHPSFIRVEMRVFLSRLYSYVRVFLRHRDLVDCRISALHNFSGVWVGLMTTRGRRVRKISANCNRGDAYGLIKLLERCILDVQITNCHICREGIQRLRTLVDVPALRICGSVIRRGRRGGYPSVRRRAIVVHRKITMSRALKIMNITHQRYYVE